MIVAVLMVVYRVLNDFDGSILGRIVNRDQLVVRASVGQVCLRLVREGCDNLISAVLSAIEGVGHMSTFISARIALVVLL